MTDDLRQRMADAIERDALKPAAEREGIIPAALASLKPELDELLHYRNAITWETSCLSCSRILDNTRAREEELERTVNYLKRNIRRSRDQVDSYDEELAGANSALDRVRALHQPVQHMGQDWCAECSHRRSTGPKTYEWVAYIPHPCPTLDAIEEEA